MSTQKGKRVGQESKTPLLLVILGCTLIRSFAQHYPEPTAALAWKQVDSHYQQSNEIKPVLANSGATPIYLSRFWPDGFAQLDRLNETTGEWEVGNWGIQCGTVSNPTIPIEVSAPSELKIDVYWQLSSDDWDKPKHFVLDSQAKRPLFGQLSASAPLLLEAVDASASSRSNRYHSLCGVGCRQVKAVYFVFIT